MVSKALKNDLFERISKYIANDVNRLGLLAIGEPPMRPSDVYIIGFQRVVNNWKVFAKVPIDIYYEITHDSETDKTFVKRYTMTSTTSEAII